LIQLEKKGLIYRDRSSSDKRKVHAFLTETGIDIVKDAPTPLQDHLARQFNDLQEFQEEKPGFEGD
jgi:DNA-binding MarR family transcriptional regulator